MFAVSNIIKYSFMLKSRVTIISGSEFSWHRTANMKFKHTLSQHAGELHARLFWHAHTHVRSHTQTHTDAPHFTPLGSLLTGFLFRTNLASQHRIGGTVGKSRNLGEETAFSCLCSNSIFILCITSHEITIVPVSIKSLERDWMSGCFKENKLFYTRKDCGFVFF